MHALWVSAKGAVDDDLVKSAFEEGELLIIELGDEQLGDPAGVDGRRFTDCSGPSVPSNPPGWGAGIVLPAYEWAQFAVAEEHYFVLAGEPPVEIN
jgi:hypothetical protein